MLYEQGDNGRGFGGLFGKVSREERRRASGGDNEGVMNTEKG